MFAQYQLTVHRRSWQQGAVQFPSDGHWWRWKTSPQWFSSWCLTALYLQYLQRSNCVIDVKFLMPDGSLFNHMKCSCPWDLESKKKTIIKANHDRLIIILPKKIKNKIRTNTAVMHSCHPFFKSAWHHTSTWCNPLCWVWQPLCDLFVYMCHCFYSSLWCYLHCIVFSKFPGNLCKWHHGKHNRVLNASFKTTVISLMSHVRWQMRDDQWHQACVGLNRVTFCGWLRDVGPLMSTTAVWVCFASLTGAAHLKHTVGLMLQQAWTPLLNPRLNKIF